jgi:long-subunit fatty acid transport protein
VPRVVILVGMLAALVAGPAHATPLVEPHVGGMVFVGPTHPHVTAIFWNPAAAGLLHGDHIYVSGAGRIDVTTVDRATISTANGEPSASGDLSFASADATAISPGGFIGFVSDLNTDRITLGIGIYLPFTERYGDAEALRYHAHGGSFYGLANTLSLSLRLAPRIIVGFGLTALIMQVDMRFSRDAALETCGTPPCDVESAAAEQRYRITTNDLFPAISVNVGALVKLGEWYLGLSAITWPFVGDRTDISKSADVQVVTETGEIVTGSGRVTTRLPFVLHAGARLELRPGTELVLGARWVNMNVHRLYDLRLVGSQLRGAGIPEWLPRYRGLKNFVSLEGGIETRLSPKVRVGGRLRFETSAVERAHVTPAQVDAPKVYLMGGAELQVTPSLAVTAGYSLGLHLPQTVDDSVFSPQAQIDCVSSGYDLDTCAPSRLGSAIPTAAGDYSRTSHELVVGVSYDWW